jgi:hypothetical protein
MAWQRARHCSLLSMKRPVDGSALTFNKHDLVGASPYYVSGLYIVTNL